MSNPLTTVTPQTLSILQNPAVLAVSQDPAASPAIRRWRHYLDHDIDPYGKKGEIQLYSSPLSGGDQVVLFLNAGSTTRAMNASLAEIFWDEGASGTAEQVKASWDVYDLWKGRMGNSTSAGVINGNGTSPYNLTARGGAQKVYSEVPASGDKTLMGTKVGSVQPRGTVSAMVRPHGVAMFRLRKKKRDEL